MSMRTKTHIYDIDALGRLNLTENQIASEKRMDRLLNYKHSYEQFKGHSRGFITNRGKS